MTDFIILQQNYEIAFCSTLLFITVVTEKKTIIVPPTLSYLTFLLQLRLKNNYNTIFIENEHLSDKYIVLLNLVESIVFYSHLANSFTIVRKLNYMETFSEKLDHFKGK